MVDASAGDALLRGEEVELGGFDQLHDRAVQLHGARRRELRVPRVGEDRQAEMEIAALLAERARLCEHVNKRRERFEREHMKAASTASGDPPRP